MSIGWRVPEFLDAVRVARDMYFDSVARVDVAKWARGGKYQKSDYV